MPTAYDPASIFSPSADDRCTPRVFISPQRYVQGDGVLDEVGRYLRLLNVRRAAVLMSDRARSSEGPRLRRSLESENLEATFCEFGGECSPEEIEGHAFALADRVDCLIAAGGGKCVDAGKSIAFRLGIPVVIVPTVASNDAPCSALSVLYTDGGVYADIEFFPQSPALVVVDTRVIAAAPERYLVAGMGDAMATWYEARACLENPNGINALSARPTLASSALGKICAETLFHEGVAAAEAVRGGTVDAALEKVVEANTLLSGLGFESGGIAVAHGVAQSCTSITRVEERHLHGEMVAIGTLVQLALEGRLDETERVARFFGSVGLPASLAQLSIDVANESDLNALVEGTVNWPYTPNMPFDVDEEMLRRALLDANEVGCTVIDQNGDAAYRRIHAE